ncbi:unnamed protein product [Darwinula stevensoni]|uniref:Uncharacterized protein n=1 Tax=Darwinula stevensoni TaxID=69355 RepID=A0A7R9A3Y7_9CRUS|nr:unnamed protein product [Darwinula stevensoni]CAG0882335.1 unnamed protein product [Darwinula stevensoni]
MAMTGFSSIDRCAQRMYICLTLSLVLVVAAVGRGDECPTSCYCAEGKADTASCAGSAPEEAPPFSTLPTSILHLEVRSFYLPRLTREGFRGLGNLTELKIEHCGIQSVRDTTFDDLSRLVRLDLSHNNITDLPETIFSQLKSLRSIDLSFNNLTNIDLMFLGLKSLEQLNLKENQIGRLTQDSFHGLENLQYLNLDRNSISFMEASTFMELPSVAHLILSRNPLPGIKSLQQFGTKLQYVDLSDLGLMEVPENMAPSSLRDFRLSGNNLTKISKKDFKSYPALSLLVLDDNHIQSIEENAFAYLSSLTKFWLNGNQLRKIPVGLPVSLKVLYIEENWLQEIPANAFSGLSQLEQLFLQRNRIEDLRFCSFCDLWRLKNLDLQGNYIQFLTDGAFKNLSQLETLDMSQNPLKEIAEHTFLPLGNLKVIQLSGIGDDVYFTASVFHPLKSLEILELFNSPKLTADFLASTSALAELGKTVRELNIMHNELRDLRRDLSDFFVRLETFKIGGNPWDCQSVNMSRLLHWIKEREGIFYRTNSIRCASPTALAQKPLSSFQDGDLNELIRARSATEAATPSGTSETQSQPETESPRIPAEQQISCIIAILQEVARAYGCSIWYRVDT